LRDTSQLPKLRRTIGKWQARFNPGPARTGAKTEPDERRAMNPIVLIPSRMASTRLPGKPLADIHGRAMILHVLDRAREAALGPVAVAAGDAAIVAAIEGDGGTAVLTDPSLPRGSDRVQAALAVLDPEGRHDVVVNLQGDLPTIPPEYLRRVLAPLADPAIDIATLVAPITSPEEAALPSVVKAAVAFDGGRAVSPALYFSRAAIPAGDGPLWHHIGIYAFRRPALARFVALPESPLEKRESLEQLRALEAGMRIACARVEHAPFGVDTPDDLERARAALAPKQ
jgi:3-deoxy-manno-octulosonate cytidylyltransferase (CMP-KDO synthetase)